SAERKAAAMPGTEPSGKPEKEASTGHRKKDKRKSERVVYLVTAAEGVTHSPTGGGKAVELQPVQIKTGINDAAYTEVIEGLKEGDEVAIGVVAATGRS